MICMLAVLLRTADDRRLAFQAFVVGALVVIAAVMINFVRGVQANLSIAVSRYSAGLANPNRTGTTVVLCMAMAWYLLRLPQTTRLWRIVNLAALVLGPLVVLLTSSRSAFLASLPIAAVLLYSTLRVSNRRRVVSLVVLFVAGSLLFAYAPQTSVDRLKAVTTSESQLGAGSVMARTSVLEVGWVEFWNRPAAGHGAGTFGVVVEPFVGGFLIAHNSYLSLLVELGIVGLVLFLAMLAYDLVHLRRVDTDERLVGYLLLVTWVIVAAFSSLEDDKMTWLVLVFVGTLGKGISLPPQPPRPDVEEAVTRPRPTGRSPGRPQGSHVRTRITTDAL